MMRVSDGKAFDGKGSLCHLTTYLTKCLSQDFHAKRYQYENMVDEKKREDKGVAEKEQFPAQTAMMCKRKRINSPWHPHLPSPSQSVGPPLTGRREPEESSNEF